MGSSVCVCVCVCVYLDLLSAQHGQLAHVSEGLQQIVVELRRGLHQISIRFVLLHIQLQQLHHPVHAALLLQQLHTRVTHTSHTLTDICSGVVTS